ncbi:MAG: Arm DNA-binding domain-containing protein, partial [Chitinophagaceae bacterium]
MYLHLRRVIRCAYLKIIFPGFIIYARITVKGERIKISLKKTIHSPYWDAKAGRVKGNKDVMR